MRVIFSSGSVADLLVGAEVTHIDSTAGGDRGERYFLHVDEWKQNKMNWNTETGKSIWGKIHLSFRRSVFWERSEFQAKKKHLTIKNTAVHQVYDWMWIKTVLWDVRMKDKKVDFTVMHQIIVIQFWFKMFDTLLKKKQGKVSAQKQFQEKRGKHKCT